MSTTIKRIALVAVAALGLGTVSVIAPTAANATFYGTVEKPFVVTVADTVSNGANYDATAGVWDSATAAAAVSVSQVAGTGNYVEIQAVSNDTTTATYVTVAVTGTTLSVAQQPTTAGPVDTFTVNSAGTVATSNNYRITGAKLRIAVPAVGTYTATVSKVVVAAGISTITDQQVFTITGTSSATRGVLVLANSSSYISDSASVTASAAGAIAATTLAADSTITASKSASGVVAGIQVRLRDGQATPAGISGKTLSVAVSGPGLVSSDWSAKARVATAVTDANGYAAFAVYADGTSGVGTITISQGTTVVGTETVTFYGSVAALASKNLKSILSTTNGAALSTAVEVKATDAAGNLVTGLSTASFSATSSDATILSSTITVVEGTAADLLAGDNNGPGYYYVSVSSASAGTIASGSKATLTIKYTLADLTTVTAPAVNFTTGGTTIYGVKLTSDVATAVSGEKVTLTLSATDKAGNPIADGSYVVLDTTTATTNAGALTSSQTLTNTLFGTGKITFLGGVKTATFYAPQSKVILSGLLGSAAPIAAAIQATTVTTTIDVTNVAIDAANEAAQAAQDATDAALAAADAADAATTAVAALSAQVNKLVAALKAQITTLTNLVLKIQKKVRA